MGRAGEALAIAGRVFSRRRALACVALALSSAGCGEPPPPAPSAVIQVCPPSVCVGDEFSTSIHLSAERSAPRLTLVESPVDPNEPPLSFEWSFSGSKMLFDRGAATDAEILVSMAADRPLHVGLRVENGEGGVAEALETISITPLDQGGVCPLPTPEDVTTDDCLAIGIEEP